MILFENRNSHSHVKLALALKIDQVFNFCLWSLNLKPLFFYFLTLKQKLVISIFLKIINKNKFITNLNFKTLKIK